MALFAFLLLCQIMYAQGESFTVKESFDDPSHFTTGDACPDGWVSTGTYPVTRALAEDYGIISHSGSYIFATTSSPVSPRDEMVYTPMYNLAGGSECTISFYYMAPGGIPAAVKNTGLVIKAGNAQTADAQTIEVGSVEGAGYAEWTKFEFTFTPETDGEYCFSIGFVTKLSMSGTVAFDDVEVSGTMKQDKPAGGEAFAVKESFDDPSHFTLSDTCPDGWQSVGTYPVTRALAEDYGIISHSGSYIFATTSSPVSPRDEMIFTPMYQLAAGNECKVSFYYMAPGGIPAAVKNTGLVIKAGNAQTADAQTIEVGSVEGAGYAEWTKFEFTFTPETDGEYCFSIGFVTKLSMSGTVAFDDFEITGAKPSAGGGDEDEFYPDVNNEVDVEALPYKESFDNENNNYDGSTYLPHGWFTTGNMPFVTVSTTDLPARTGKFYAYTDYSTEKRNECLYTPFFMLEAGKEYEISSFVHLDKKNFTDETNSVNSLSIRVSIQQDNSCFRELKYLENYSNFDPWEEQKVTFVPEVSGAYCFSYCLTSDGPYSGFVAIEDFSITQVGVEQMPEANFGVSQLYDIATGELVAYPGQGVKLVDLSKNAKSYKYTLFADYGEAQLDDETAAEPVVTFLSSGIFTIKQEVTNSLGTSETFKEYSVTIYEGECPDYGITATGPNDKVKMRNEIPTFKLGENEYITGPNHYYRHFAERVPVADDVTAQIKTLNLILTNLHFKSKNTTSDEQYNAPLDIVFYGETDGKLDETKEFGRLSSTVSEIFGRTGIGASYGEPRDVVFETPIETVGTFYITFEFSDIFDLEVDDPNIGCSYMSLGSVRHESLQSSLYGKADMIPEETDLKLGEWYEVEQYSDRFDGMGLWYVLWITSADGTVTAINNAGSVVFDVRVADDRIYVSGTEAGDDISIYDISGRMVRHAVASGNGASVSAEGMAAGIYVVKTDAGTKKIRI